MSTVFLVNHHHSNQCGVYQHGSRVAQICLHSDRHQYVSVEANSPTEFFEAVDRHGKPDVAVFNFHPITLPWSSGFTLPGMISVGTMHEGTWLDAINVPGNFPFWIWHDPSIDDLRGRAKNMYGALRPLPWFVGQRTDDGVPVLPRRGGNRPLLGSFGFAFGGKGFELAHEYAVARGADLRFHLPEAYFGGDPNQVYVNQLRAAYPDVEITTGFLSEQELLSWLVENDENVLLYHWNWGRGISSASDFCVAAGRPMTLSDSSQFRHIHHAFAYWEPDYPVPKIRTYDPMPLQRAWHPTRFLERHDDIIDALGALGA